MGENSKRSLGEIRVLRVNAVGGGYTEGEGPFATMADADKWLRRLAPEGVYQKARLVGPPLAVSERTEVRRDVAPVVDPESPRSPARPVGVIPSGGTP